MRMYKIGLPQGPCTRCNDKSEARYAIDNGTQRITVMLCKACKWLSAEDLFEQLGGINHGTKSNRA